MTVDVIWWIYSWIMLGAQCFQKNIFGSFASPEGIFCKENKFTSPWTLKGGRLKIKSRSFQIFITSTQPQTPEFVNFSFLYHRINERKRSLMIFPRSELISIFLSMNLFFDINDEIYVNCRALKLNKILIKFNAHPKLFLNKSSHFPVFFDMI